MFKDASPFEEEALLVDIVKFIKSDKTERKKFAIQQLNDAFLGFTYLDDCVIRIKTALSFA